MKNIYKVVAVCAGLFAFAVNSHAQTGLEVGYTNSTHYFSFNGESQHARQSGFYVELEYAVGIIGGLKIAPGIAYNYLAGESKFPVVVKPDMSKPGEMTQKSPVLVEHYLSIPIDVSYTFSFGRAFGLTAFVTPKLNCGLKSDVKLGNSSTNVYRALEDATGEKNAYSAVDFMLGVGVSADIASHFRVKFSYDFGLLDRMNISGIDLRRNQLNVGIGFLF